MSFKSSAKDGNTLLALARSLRKKSRMSAFSLAFLGTGGLDPSLAQIETALSNGEVAAIYFRQCS